MSGGSLQVDLSGVDNKHPLPCLQLTVLNAGRRYLGLEDLAGKVFVTSGLGGMSGAQAKAAAIVGCIGVIAEVRWGASACSSELLTHSFSLPLPFLLSLLSLPSTPFLSSHTPLPSLFLSPNPVTSSTKPYATSQVRSLWQQMGSACTVPTTLYFLCPLTSNP